MKSTLEQWLIGQEVRDHSRREAEFRGRTDDVLIVGARFA